jgi:hypothetical protein
MILNKLDQSTHNNAYYALFGRELFKNSPLFVYAENLFYMGMDQFIPDYQGGCFDFFSMQDISETLELEPTGFIPVLDCEDRVTVNGPGASATMSFKAASITVWCFVLNQIAINIDNESLSQRLYYVFQDIREGLKGFTLDNQDFLTSDDIKQIHRLLD